jgi:hypothetical protein
MTTNKVLRGEYAMSHWKSRTISKTTKGSQTPGIKKGIHPSQLERYMCRRNRSYKHADYARVMASLGLRKAKQS